MHGIIGNNELLLLLLLNGTRKDKKKQLNSIGFFRIVFHHILFIFHFIQSDIYSLLSGEFFFVANSHFLVVKHKINRLFFLNL